MDWSNLGLLSGLFGGGGAGGAPPANGADDPMAAAKMAATGPGAGVNALPGAPAASGGADVATAAAGAVPPATPFSMPSLNPNQTAMLRQYAQSMLKPQQQAPQMQPIRYARAPGLINQPY